MQDVCHVTVRAGQVARGYEDFVGRGLQDQSLEDVTSNLGDELKDEALSAFLSSVSEGLSIKDCVVRVQDQALRKVPNERNKWFIRFVYDNKLKIEIGVNMFKNGNSQLYHSLGLHNPDKEENECPLAYWTPCACKDGEHHSNDSSQPCIEDQDPATGLPGTRGTGRKPRSRSVDGRPGKAGSVESQEPRERPVSVVGERKVRGLEDCFRYGDTPSQDKLKNTVDVSWGRRKGEGETGIFALQNSEEHKIWKNVKVFGERENIEHKAKEADQSKVTKLVFHPDKEADTNTASYVSKPNTDTTATNDHKYSSDHWVRNCLEIDDGLCQSDAEIDSNNNNKDTKIDTNDNDTNNATHNITTGEDTESVSDASVEIFLETSQCESDLNETQEDLTFNGKGRQEDIHIPVVPLTLLDLLIYDQSNKQRKDTEKVKNNKNDKEWEPFEEEEDIQEVKAIFSKPFTHRRKAAQNRKNEKEWEPFEEVKDVDENELIQEVNPVFSKPFTHLAVQMWGEVAEIGDVKEGCDPVQIDPFLSKPFSPQLGRKWKAEVIVRKRNWPIDTRTQ